MKCFLNYRGTCLLHRHTTFPMGITVHDRFTLECYMSVTRTHLQSPPSNTVHRSWTGCPSSYFCDWYSINPWTAGLHLPSRFPHINSLVSVWSPFTVTWISSKFRSWSLCLLHCTWAHLQQLRTPSQSTPITFPRNTHPTMPRTWPSSGKRGYWFRRDSQTIQKHAIISNISSSSQ